jgi:expansin (peptidoglycan-binding protein)
MEEGYRTLLANQPFKDKVSVEWHIVSCRFTAPLAVQNAPGVSKYWFSMQVQNSNYPVSQLEVSTDHGETWKKTVSRDYNFFEGENGGFGTDMVDLKISCFNGKVVEMKNVSIAKDKKVWAESNC